jgi:hypothetical protein
MSDSQVGLKAGRGDASNRIFNLVLVKRHASGVKTLAVVQLLRLKLVEIPVRIQLGAHFKRDISDVS